MNEISGIMPFCKEFFLKFVSGLLAFIKCDIGFVTKFKYSMMINILDNNFLCCYFTEYVIHGNGWRENRFVFSGFIFVTCRLLT